MSDHTGHLLNCQGLDKSGMSRFFHLQCRGGQFINIEENKAVTMELDHIGHRFDSTKCPIVI